VNEGTPEGKPVFFFIDVFLWTNGEERKRPAGTQLVKRMQRWMPTIKMVSGLVLAVVGLVLLYNFAITLA